LKSLLCAIVARCSKLCGASRHTLQVKTNRCE
jgi:hypothetical protein